MDFVAVARELVGFLEGNGRPVALVGGFALHAYGAGRATQDLDFLTVRAAQAELVAFLEAHGYETLHCSAGFSNHLHPEAAAGRVDIVYVDDTTAERLFERATRREVLEGVATMVPAPEHLAAMKVRAMANDPSRRLQEMADIQRLLRYSDVDRKEVREYFDRLGLLGAYEEIERTL